MKYSLQSTRVLVQCEDEKEKSFLQSFLIEADIMGYVIYANNNVSFARGYLSIFLKVVSRHFKVVPIENQLWKYRKLSHIPNPLPSLRDDVQKDAIEFMSMNKERSALIVQPGSGKTVMGIYQAILYGGKTLIVCPTNNIRDQWYSTIVNLFKIPSNKVCKCKTLEDIVKNEYDWFICLHQTITHKLRMPNSNLPSLFKNSNICTKIIDESHLFFKGTLYIDSLTNFHHSLYLTATFGRSSEEENIQFKRLFNDLPKFDTTAPASFLDYLFGKKTHSFQKHVILTSVLVDSMLTRSQLNSIVVSKYGLHQMKYANLIFPLQNISIFERQILAFIKKVISKLEYGRVLILYPTIFACEKHLTLLRELLPNKSIGVMNSAHSKSENTKVRDTCDIVISTSKSSGVGLDLRDLSCVIACEQYNSEITSVQMHGRLRQRANNESTWYYDIRDNCHPQLIKWANNRLRVMRNISASLSSIDIRKWWETFNMSYTPPIPVREIFKESPYHTILSNYTLLEDSNSLHDLLLGGNGEMISHEGSLKESSLFQLSGYPYHTWRVYRCENISHLDKDLIERYQADIQSNDSIVTFGLA